MKYISAKVIFYALIKKIKKMFNSKYDPYLPLPNNLYLSPSSNTFELFKKASFSMSFSKSKFKPLVWQNKARKKLSILAGYDRNREIPKLSKIEKEMQISDSIFRRRIYVKVNKKSDIPINLIYKKPLKNKLDVFIFLAGSTSGVHLGWGETKQPIDHQRVYIGADMAKQAAEKGYLAVTFEQAGYGERIERHLKQKSKSNTIDLANHLLLIGKTLTGNGASELSSIIDWLCLYNKLININKSNIFLFGHSAGGTLAQFASALDTRIKVTLASGSVGPILKTMGSRGTGSGDGIIPGQLKWFDSSDIIALIAPRIFIGLSGDNDHIFPYSGVNKVINEAKVFYKKLKASKNILGVKVMGKHQYYSEASWQAWEKYIKKK